MFQFLLLRLCFRVFVWARFLWQVARIELNLMPTHHALGAGHPGRVVQLAAAALLPLAPLALSMMPLEGSVAGGPGDRSSATCY